MIDEWTDLLVFNSKSAKLCTSIVTGLSRWKNTSSGVQSTGRQTRQSIIYERGCFSHLDRRLSLAVHDKREKLQTDGGQFRRFQGETLNEQLLQKARRRAIPLENCRRTWKKGAWNYFSAPLEVVWYLSSVSLKYVLVNGLIVADVTSNAYDCIIASVLSFKSASRRRTIATRLSAHRILMLHDNEPGMDTLVNSNTAFTCSSIEDFSISVFSDIFRHTTGDGILYLITFAPCLNIFCGQ